METLERLPNIIRLSGRVIRVLGQNPSKFTLQGTNTYLIGKGPKKVLLDTGEGVPDYIPLLQEALNKEADHATISKVICTHWHHDHVGGIQDVLSFLAARNIQLYSPPTTAADAGSAASNTAKGLVDVDTSASVAPAEVYKFLCPDHDDPETQFQALHDGDIIRVDEETTLLALHTPGHTSDHCSFFLKEENTLFTADCVLGQGTAVFEDLESYIRSLEKQLIFPEAMVALSDEKQLQPSYKIYPGHGPVIEDGPSKIREYIKHRYDRERQVHAVLAAPSIVTTNSITATSDSSSDHHQGGEADTESESAKSTVRGGAGKTAMDIVKVIYHAYPASLHLPAQHQVLLHLKKLEEEGKVRRDPTEDIVDAVWEVVPQTQSNL
ncbi:hypothetical protein FBU30_006107 [Linnemannia zychae]|nr:hypothetical protein FBU30_006107 [Linnemannia zychae]